MELSKLRARLLNWGEWLSWEAEIGPKGARCISIESRHIPEAGEVWDDPGPIHAVPDVPDAEFMEAHIRKLECLQQYALAITYGGMPTVMRFRRVGEHAMQHNLELAELLLYEALRKSA